MTKIKWPKQLVIWKKQLCFISCLFSFPPLGTLNFKTWVWWLPQRNGQAPYLPLLLVHIFLSLSFKFLFSGNPPNLSFSLSYYLLITNKCRSRSNIGLEKSIMTPICSFRHLCPNLKPSYCSSSVIKILVFFAILYWVLLVLLCILIYPQRHWDQFVFHFFGW